jgi:hypothetical protein
MIFQFNYDKTAAGLLTTGVYSIKDLTTGTNPVIDLSTCKTIVNLHVTAQASIFGDLDTTTSQTISYNDATTYIQTFSLAGGTQSQTY